ncbi:hypothetical protein [Polyangium fumosum]|uniref:hypothetical protein n=1 Tax=Polyangium fumosum TaxID=889272 RepID=UPI00147892A6|nr:hypothetical protein [Polyangium fumosum]
MGRAEGWGTAAAELFGIERMIGQAAHQSDPEELKRRGRAYVQMGLGDVLFESAREVRGQEIRVIDGRVGPHVDRARGDEEIWGQEQGEPAEMRERLLDGGARAQGDVASTLRQRTLGEAEEVVGHVDGPGGLVEPGEVTDLPEGFEGMAARAGADPVFQGIC